MLPQEILLVRPRAWSMRTEFRRGDEVVAFMSGSRRFGLMANATVGDRTYVLKSAGRGIRRFRMREAGKMDDTAVLEQTGPASATICLGGEDHVLSRTEGGLWEFRSAARGAIIEFILDPMDPSQGKAVINIHDENVLLMAVLSCFTLRAMEV